MGADIFGWVETRDPGAQWWHSAIRIHDIVYRSYAMFASLFGIRNGPTNPSEDGRFHAIAAGRGAPPGASEFYVGERDNYGGQVGETWVLGTELAAIDWDEEGVEDIDFELPHTVIEESGQTLRRERRGDFLNGGWITLFKLIALLCEQFGAENVRLCVWFDQW